MADSLSSITGVASGIDWKTLVDQIVKSERRPADRLQAKIDGNLARKEALAGFQATLRKLQSATDGLRFGGAFNQFTVGATGTASADGAGRAVVAAAVSGVAAPGRYAVTVSQLASNQKTVASVGQASATAAMGLSGALMIGGERITVAASDSVSKLRDAINAVQAKTGVQATLVAGKADGSDQRLVLTSTRPGAAGAFAVTDAPDGSPPPPGEPPVEDPPPPDEPPPVEDPSPPDDPPPVEEPPPEEPIPEEPIPEEPIPEEPPVEGLAASAVASSASGFSLAAALGLDGAPAVAARDAALTVDGVQITRPTNAVSNAIAGVTLTLSAAGTSEVSVARVPTAGAEAVRGFVDAYNAVQEAIRAQGTIGKDGTLPPLHNDPLLRSLRGPLATGIVRPAAAANADGSPTGVAGDLSTLASVGVSLQKDGTLAFDASKFQGAADARLADVQALLAERTQAVADVVGGAVTPYVGSIDTRQRTMDAQNVTYTTRIADVDARIDKRRAALLAQYAKFEASLGLIKSVGDAMSAQFSGLNKSNSK
jgi:flagellar hook-associated protein 2